MTSLASLSADDLDLLARHTDKLSDSERLQLRAIISQKQRGYRMNRWMKLVAPTIHPKQQVFLSLEHREVMFGGAASGGKSHSLLLAAMQYVDVPGYSAILFRKSFPDLNQAGALMSRCKQWLTPTEARWSARDMSWYFPTGKGKEPARMAFGHIGTDGDKYKYLGAEYQFIGFDELVQHPYDSYSYLFSRLRKLETSHVPLRMRSATNPGGVHGDWVKDYFVPKEYLTATADVQNGRVWESKAPCVDCSETGLIDGEECIYCEGNAFRSRYFVPSKVADNPSVDRAAYLRSLISMTHVDRYRLEHGDWAITEQGDLFKTEWARYYSRNGDHFRLHRPDGQPPIVLAIGELVFFITADTASKEKTTADFTCISTWAFHQKSGSLILVHTLLARLEVPKIAEAIINQSKASRCQFVMIESAQCGIGVIQELRGPKGNGMAVQDYNPGGADKVARSTTAQIKLESGQIYFPDGRPGWLDIPFAQMVGFPAATHDDFVDTLSMAASWAHSRHQAGNGGEPAILRPVGR